MEKIKFNTSGYYEFIEDETRFNNVGEWKEKVGDYDIWIHYRSQSDFVEVVGYDNGKKHGLTLKFSLTEDGSYRITDEIIYLNDYKISEKSFSFNGELKSHKIFGYGEIEYEYCLINAINSLSSISITGFHKFSSGTLKRYLYKTMCYLNFKEEIEIIAKCLAWFSILLLLSMVFYDIRKILFN